MKRAKKLVFWTVAVFTPILFCFALVLLARIFSHPRGSLGDVLYLPEIAVIFLSYGVETIWKWPEVGVPATMFVIGYVAAPLFCAQTDFEKRWAKYLAVWSVLALWLFPIGAFAPVMAGLASSGAGK